MYIQLVLVLDTLELNWTYCLTLYASHFSTMFQYVYKVTELKYWLYAQVKYNLFFSGRREKVSR